VEHSEFPRLYRVRLTAETATQLIAEAKKREMSVSGLMRMCIKSGLELPAGQQVAGVKCAGDPALVSNVMAYFDKLVLQRYRKALENQQYSGFKGEDAAVRARQAVVSGNWATEAVPYVQSVVARLKGAEP